MRVAFRSFTQSTLNIRSTFLKNMMSCICSIILQPREMYKIRKICHKCTGFFIVQLDQQQYFFFIVSQVPSSVTTIFGFYLIRHNLVNNVYEKVTEFIDSHDVKIIVVTQLLLSLCKSDSEYHAKYILSYLPSNYHTLVFYS